MTTFRKPQTKAPRREPEQPALRRLAACFGAHPLPHLLISPFENAVLIANRAAERHFGIDCEGFAHVKFSDLFEQDSIGFLHVATQQAMSQGFAWTRALRPAGASDAIGALEHCLVAEKSEGTLLILMSIQDVDAHERRSIDDEADTMHRAGLSEWRRAERFLREIERRHHLILSAAGEGIYGVDANGITTFVNPAAEAMLGYRADELIGLEMHQKVHHKHSDGSHYPVHECPIYNAFRSNKITTVDDECFWRKDGKPLRVEYTSTPLLENGEAAGAVIVFRDISQRKADEERLRGALSENAALRERLEKENAYLQEQILTQSNHHQILGRSEAIQRIIRQIDVVAGTSANVLITGESGTGKELVAGAIHQASARTDRPLIRVNCAAVPRELFESEFFGHVRGSFSGAIRDRVGRFELADGGTLFLDEVGEIPLELQSKLLRVLQEGSFERVGEEKTRQVDVRIIAATNRDLKAEVEQGRFREDLFFRLNVFPIECSPLRQRRDDIPLLAQHFLRLSCQRLNVAEPRLSRANVEELERYTWPGNARELQNVIERAAILARQGRLMFNLPAGPKAKQPTRELPVAGVASRILTAAEMQDLEERNIRAALNLTGGRVAGPNGAAELLAMKPQTLYSRLRKLDFAGSS
ncbi:MAG: sigma 54-interacting transcriptional regulator [Alphaproteobacteria bacterium]|nr:sigma 54-interacting transcriptional regulator [Alphaproteobacteria bacterium]